MIAAKAPMKEQNYADLRALALEDSIGENDALSADLTLGGPTEGQSRIQRVVSAVVTRSQRETCDANATSWLDGASSSDEDGAETAPGASAWVQARPSGPHAHSPRHPLQDRYSPPLHGRLCMRPTALARLPPLAQCVARPWNNWVTLLSCAASPRCHGDTTLLSKPGKPFAMMLASLPTSNKKRQSSHLVSFDGSQRLLQRRRRGPSSARGRGSDELGSQPHRRAADRGRGRGRRTRGAPKAPRMESRRNIGMYGEIGPLGLREPRPLRAKRSWRGGPTGSIEGRLDGRVTDRGSECHDSKSRPLASLAQRRTPVRELRRWCSQHWSSLSWRRSTRTCS